MCQLFIPRYLAIPTKLFIYNSDDQLAAVELPAVPDPDNSGALTRPRYEYGYNAQGNQTLIRDPLGRETRFTFSAQGQQVTRTLPLGFGSDGIASASDLSNLLSDPSSLSFTERTTYDARGRQHLHTSFEGVISENIYDSFGRLDRINFYADQAAFDASTISERWSYEYDSHGRKSAAIHSANNGGVLTPDRIEETFYDDRGRVIAESVPEGVLGYTYDSQSRLASTAVFAAGDDPFIDAPERITSYGYDILGRLASVTEDSTPTNTSDEPQSETDYGFDLQGRQRLIHTLTGNNTVPMPSLLTVMQYDRLGRLDTLTDYSVDPQDSSLTTQASYDYTVRADGKRTALYESTWFDLNEDGIQTANELKANNYSWSYDDAGRLTDEVLDHWDDTFDQTESFAFDLTGNRTAVTLDKNNDSTIDKSTEYRFDANDRLFAELADDQTATNADTTTVFNFDHTQQTGNTVYSGLLDEATLNAIAGGGDDSAQTRVSSETRTYNLQGRLATLTKQSYDAGGTPTTRERSTYEYDSRSFRVRQLIEDWNDTTDQYELKTDTEFLVDHHNHTGYAQTQRETTTNADGSTKTIDYTFGLDELTQRAVEHDSSGLKTHDSTLTFGHDGHGSVRASYTNTAGIKQVYTYSAYGVRLSIHDAQGQEVAFQNIATQMAYAGEFFDAVAQLSYNRARFYDAVQAQWNRLDPYQRVDFRLNRLRCAIHV